MMASEERHPTLAELGFGVTIALAAITDDDQIVTVSDRLISFGDVIHGVDDVLKASGIAHDWGCLFAANNANLFSPMTRLLAKSLFKTGERRSLGDVQKAASACYAELFDSEFSTRFLSRFRFDDIRDFKKTGFNELGGDRFGILCDEILKFDLGISLVVFGHDTLGNAHVFHVMNPGVIIDGDLLGVAVAGSGQYIALGTLMSHGFRPTNCTSTIYRLLEAKFNAESASGVGKTTTLMIHRRDNVRLHVLSDDIEKIRGVWKSAQNVPIDSQAMKIIEESIALNERLLEEEQKATSPSPSPVDSSALPHAEPGPSSETLLGK